jgi:hypothetical protein
MIFSMKSKVWSSLVVPGNGLGEDTVLETMDFFSMKTQDL